MKTSERLQLLEEKLRRLEAENEALRLRLEMVEARTPFVPMPMPAPNSYPWQPQVAPVVPFRYEPVVPPLTPMWVGPDPSPTMPPLTPLHPSVTIS